MRSLPRLTGEEEGTSYADSSDARQPERYENLVASEKGEIGELPRKKGQKKERPNFRNKSASRGVRKPSISE